MYRALLVSVLALALLTASGNHASADDEGSSQTKRVVTAKNATAKLNLRFESSTKPAGGSWRYSWSRGSKKRSGVLAKIPVHAHVVAFVPETGKRFAVIETSAGHRLENRVFIYRNNGKLIKAFGLNDLFTKAEVTKITSRVSTSHMQWFDQSKTPCCKTEDHGDTVVIKSRFGAPVRISISKATASR